MWVSGFSELNRSVTSMKEKLFWTAPDSSKTLNVLTSDKRQGSGRRGRNWKLSTVDGIPYQCLYSAFRIIIQFLASPIWQYRLSKTRLLVQPSLDKTAEPLSAMHCTACGHRIAHRKWKETKLQPGKNEKNEKLRKWNSPKVVSDPVAFKLDSLNLLSLFCSKNFHQLFFIVGSPIPYYHRERGRKWEKGFTKKWMPNRGFCTLGIQTGLSEVC